MNNHTLLCFSKNTQHSYITIYMPKYFDNKTQKITLRHYVILTLLDNLSNKGVVFFFFFFSLYSLVLWIPVHLAKSTHLGEKSSQKFIRIARNLKRMQEGSWRNLTSMIPRKCCQFELRSRLHSVLTCACAAKALAFFALLLPQVFGTWMNKRIMLF